MDRQEEPRLSRARKPRATLSGAAAPRAPVDATAGEPIGDSDCTSDSDDADEDPDGCFGEVGNPWDIDDDTTLADSDEVLVQPRVFGFVHELYLSPT